MAKLSQNDSGNSILLVENPDDISFSESGEMIFRVDGFDEGVSTSSLPENTTVVFGGEGGGVSHTEETIIGEGQMNYSDIEWNPITMPTNIMFESSGWEFNASSLTIPENAQIDAKEGCEPVLHGIGVEIGDGASVKSVEIEGMYSVEVGKNADVTATDGVSSTCGGVEIEQGGTIHGNVYAEDTILKEESSINGNLATGNLDTEDDCKVTGNVILGLAEDVHVGSGFEVDGDIVSDGQYTLEKDNDGSICVVENETNDFMPEIDGFESLDDFADADVVPFTDAETDDTEDQIQKFENQDNYDDDPID